MSRVFQRTSTKYVAFMLFTNVQNLTQMYSILFMFVNYPIWVIYIANSDISSGMSVRKMSWNFIKISKVLFSLMPFGGSSEEEDPGWKSTIEGWLLRNSLVSSYLILLQQCYLIWINPDQRRDWFLNAELTMNPDNINKQQEDITPGKWLIGKHLLDGSEVLRIIIYL